MSDARPAGASKLMVVVGALTLVAVGATLGVSALVSPSPRSFVADVATGFVCLVETVIGLLIVGSLARRRGAGAGGASTAVLVAVTVAYAFVGFATLSVYAVIRGGRDADGHGLWAVLLVETAMAFIAGGAFCGAADAVAGAEAPALARRAVHAELAREIRVAAARLRAMTTREPAEMKELDAVAKRLDVIESALAHSSGGGVGSREGGGSRASDPAVEEDLALATRALAADAALVAPGADLAAALHRVAVDADRVRSNVDRLGLA